MTKRYNAHFSDTSPTFNTTAEGERCPGNIQSLILLGCRFRIQAQKLLARLNVKVQETTSDPRKSSQL